MFTLEQIEQAHSRVASGADFPRYIGEIKELGVTSYEVSVSDGHTDYFGADSFQLSSSSTYDPLTIALVSDHEQFQSDLKNHQNGNTDYHTFCHGCAKSGIQKWVVSLAAMTCTYYDALGNEVLIEKIPE